MKQSKELYNALRKVLYNGPEVFPAFVKSVDKDNCTCDVEYDGLEIGDVRLRATIKQNEKGAKIFPKVGSVVLVQRLGEKEEFFITFFSEVEEIKFEVEGVRFKVDASGIEMNNGNASMREVMDDLFGQVKAISNELQKVVVAVGVTPNVPALQGINLQIDNNRNKAKDLLK